MGGPVSEEPSAADMWRGLGIVPPGEPPPAPKIELPTLYRLDELLAEPDEEVRYRIDQLWPAGGRVMFVAQYKAGKTTTVGNLVRSLVDGDRFLGTFEVSDPGGPVAVIDDELDVRTIRRWYRDQGIQATERVFMVSVRGQLAALDLRDEDTVQAWAQRFRLLGVKVIVLDCLSPAIAAAGINENDTGEVRRFLAGFDRLLLLSGAGEGIVVHHMGHQHERGRGASGLRDWPDAEWTLTRMKPERADEEPDPRAPRFFRAYGRDVDVPESGLDYDPGTRRLTLPGQSRRDVGRDKHVPLVVEIVTSAPGMTSNQLDMAMRNRGVPEKQAREARKRAVETGAVVAMDGPNKSLVHHPVSGAARYGTGTAPHPVSGAAGPIGAAPPPHGTTPGAATPLFLQCAVCYLPLDPAGAVDGCHPSCYREDHP